MKKNLKKISLLLPILCLISICFVSCYETSEGCLEKWASNFDISADINCNDCCTEPKFSFNLNWIYNQETLNQDSFYTNVNNQTYRILNARFLMNRFKVWNIEQDTLKKLDTTIIKDRIYVDDFKFVTKTIQSNSIATVRDITYVDSISFYFGLESALLDTSIITKDNGEIATALDNLYDYDVDSLALFKIDLVIDSAKTDTFSFSYFGEGEAFYKERFNLTQDLSEGVNKTINIDIDLKTWFDDVNLDTLNKTMTGNSMFNYFRSAITIQE